VEEFVAGTIVNDEDEDISTSSLELLLEDTHEYDFKAVGCIGLADPVLVFATES
jgi:hypothetical protein